MLRVYDVVFAFLFSYLICIFLFSSFHPETHFISSIMQGIFIGMIYSFWTNIYCQLRKIMEHGRGKW
jgi:hypothetical protein